MQYENYGDGIDVSSVQQMRCKEGRLQEDIQPTIMAKHVHCEAKENTEPHKNHVSIVCVPSSVNFVNFEVGKLYMQRLRIINKSPTELRVSIKPPASSQMRVELCSKLVIVAGGDASVKLHFRPKEALPTKDEILIRVTTGQDLRIPISCYIEHPVLNVIVNDGVAKCEDSGIYIGAVLMGDTLRVPITFHSDAGHAKFIIISDKSWSDLSLDFDDVLLHKAMLHTEVIRDTDGNSIASSDYFSVSPSCFAGGTVPATLIYCTSSVGFHIVLFRILSYSSIVRSLHFFADTVMYKPSHIRLKADERDYDIITGVEDPSCDYFIHLGRTAPRGELTRIILLDNISPVSYKYYWSVRPWSNCRCQYESSEATDVACCCKTENSINLSLPHLSVYAKPSRGILSSGASVPVEVHLYCAGQMPGVERSVLILNLTEVPIESVPPGNFVVKKEYVEEETVPGLAKKRTRVVCDVVCAQLEVWWEVVPVIYVLHPPCLKMRFSRRVQSIPLTLNMTELHGLAGTQRSFGSPAPVSLKMVPAGTKTATVMVPLKDANGDIFIRLRADDGSCTAPAYIECCPDPEHPSLSPPYLWAGVVPPHGAVSAQLVLRNDTSRVIHWRSVIYDCAKDAVVTKPSCGCGDRCPDCLLNPYLGTLEVAEEVLLKYKRTAARTEGWKATLVQVSADGDVTSGCATLIAYRVLEPRLVLRVITDGGNKHEGSALLRPPSPLWTGSSTDHQLSVTNTTSVPTVLRWETVEDKDEPLRVMFSPNVTEVGGYATVDVTVTLVARKVCDLRIFVCKASVRHATKPVYLPVVTAVTGIEVHVDVPMEDGTIRKIVLTERPADSIPKDVRNMTQDEIIEEFQKTGRISAYANDDTNRCAPVSRKPGGVSNCCLEFIRVPVETVSSKSLVLRVVTGADAAAVLTVRRWPRREKSQTCSDEDQWMLHDSGVTVECMPWWGMLHGGERRLFRVGVRGDTWGVYHDQLLLLVQNLEPLVLNLWVEVVGPPLKFVTITGQTDYLPPALWLSSTDPKRVLRALNYTRADINVYVFIVTEHAANENKQPFRLYFRLYNVSTECVCVKKANGMIDINSPNKCLHPDIDIELFLEDDCGKQDSRCYRVEPEYALVEKDQRVQWEVSLLENSAPPSALVFRSTAVQRQGQGWYRPPVPPQLVGLRSSARAPHLQVSHSQLAVEICALDLSPNDIIRIRRTLEIKNSGNGLLALVIKTTEPWLVTEVDKCSSTGSENDKTEVQDLQRELTMKTIMQPHSTREIIVELQLDAKQVIPEPGDQYTPYLLTTTPMYFYDDAGEELLNIPLIMHVDRPVLIAAPGVIDFGLVSAGYAKKTYFTIRHTNSTRTVDLRVYGAGDDNFKLHPEELALAPRESRNVYVQYTCKGEHEDTARALVRVRACGAAWCVASVQARARPTRHIARAVAQEHSDFTVDTELQPPLW